MFAKKQNMNNICRIIRLAIVGYVRKKVLNGAGGQLDPRINPNGVVVLPKSKLLLFNPNAAAAVPGNLNRRKK